MTENEDATTVSNSCIDADKNGNANLLHDVVIQPLTATGDESNDAALCAEVEPDLKISNINREKDEVCIKLINSSTHCNELSPFFITPGFWVYRQANFILHYARYNSRRKW